MYKIPEDFDITILRNEIISHISFGLNFITLFFSKGFIQFTGGFSFRSHGESFNYDEVYRLNNDAGLLSLIEKKLVDVSISKDRNGLTIRFEDGSELCLYSSEAFESFEINIQGRRIIV